MSLLVKRFQGLPATPRYCEDCKTDHIGEVPCGMTWLERMRSTRTDEAVLESRTRKDYFDDEPLKDVFGSDRKERTEEMMEETKGVGAVHSSDRLTEQANKVFFGDD